MNGILEDSLELALGGVTDSNWQKHAFVVFQILKRQSNGVVKITTPIIEGDKLSS